MNQSVKVFYPIYDSPDEAKNATDGFYWDKSGFQYSEDYVTQWIKNYVKLPRSGSVLDLCCGDAIWSKGIQNINPELQIYGIDISEGAIEKAKQLLKTDDQYFIVGDAETELPFPDDFFNLVFARGPGLYNQHSMDREATIKVIEAWHSKLKINSLFYSIFASTPEKMGTYTSMENVKLPYNRCPRKTESVDFLGGKYHHTIKSFLIPFWKASNVRIVRYSFLKNSHILVTQRKHDD